jgi:hypothetical protein
MVVGVSATYLLPGKSTTPEGSEEEFGSVSLSSAQAFKFVVRSLQASIARAFLVLSA